VKSAPKKITISSLKKANRPIEEEKEPISHIRDESPLDKEPSIASDKEFPLDVSLSPTTKEKPKSDIEKVMQHVMNLLTLSQGVPNEFE
jgi:hypothetical protein